MPEELAAAVAAGRRGRCSRSCATQLGLDEVVAVNVGAAPTPVEVLEFFHAIGIPIGELWGMSETCGVGDRATRPRRSSSAPSARRCPGSRSSSPRTARCWSRATSIMAGYRNLPEKTAETIDDDGWLATGDIGELDEDGYLKIVDRKKELIINAAGKNMSPANIESKLKAASPLIGQAVAIGDARPYNVALIVLDPDFAPVWAKQNGLEGKSRRGARRRGEADRRRSRPASTRRTRRWRGSSRSRSSRSCRPSGSPAATS